jgi:uncharacterized LabA/DUF88 family protein
MPLEERLKVAVFVDAGYLYASACIARYNTNQPRLRVNLNIDAVVAQLKLEVAALDGGGNRLIRIYWYDGAPLSGKTADQTYTGSLADVKLRLGTVNYYGQQKGVDALIAHDLSELARNGAIDAAVIVSGDEDILVGVQTAQSFGVRVHVLGVSPARSQSEKLMHEADVCHEWPAGLVAPWVSLKPAPIPVRAHGTNGDDPESRRITSVPEMMPIVSSLMPVVEGRESGIFDNWERGQRISQDVDRELMKTLSGVLGRQLTPQEKPGLRQLFIDTLHARIEHGEDAGAEQWSAQGDDASSAANDAAYADADTDADAGAEGDVDAGERAGETNGAADTNGGAETANGAADTNGAVETDGAPDTGGAGARPAPVATAARRTAAERARS